METDAYATFAALEEYHFWFVSRRRIFFRLLADLTGGRRDLRVLEIGCGPGGMLGGLQRFGEVAALDIEHEAVRITHSRGFHRAVTGSGYALPFADGTFDLVAMFDTLEHIPDDRRALVEVRRVLRPGGHLFVTVPAYQWLFSQNDRIAHHLRRYTAGRLKRAMRAAGLGVRRTSYYNLLLFPLIVPVVLLSKLREKFGLLPPGRHNMSHVPSRPMNALLTGVMSSERLLLPHLRLPFGHSLIGIARAPGE